MKNFSFVKRSDSIGCPQKGIALIAVLVALAIMSLVAIVVLQNAKRDQQNVKSNNDDLKFIEITSRLRNIMGSRALCTCNLKDTRILPAGPIQYGSKMRIDESPTALPEVFGFYKLRSAGGDRGCETVPPTIDLNEDAVLSFRTGAVLPRAIQAKYAEISGFELMTSISPTLNRYKAKLTFAAKDKFSLTKSNLNSPIEFDVFVEVDSTSGENLIKQCFQPLAAALPSPSASVSPCVASGGGTWQEVDFVSCVDVCGVTPNCVSCWSASYPPTVKILGSPCTAAECGSPAKTSCSTCSSWRELKCQ